MKILEIFAWAMMIIGSILIFGGLYSYSHIQEIAGYNFIIGAAYLLSNMLYGIWKDYTNPWRIVVTSKITL